MLLEVCYSDKGALPSTGGALSISVTSDATWRPSSWRACLLARTSLKAFRMIWMATTSGFANGAPSEPYRQQIACDGQGDVNSWRHGFQDRRRQLCAIAGCLTRSDI